MVKPSRCNPGIAPTAWRQLTRTRRQALTLLGKALNNVGCETTKVPWLPLCNLKQCRGWADKQRTMRRTRNRMDVPLSLKCACCLLFLPASSTRTPLQPQWCLQAIHLTGGRSLCSREAALCRRQVGLLVRQLKAAIVFVVVVGFFLLLFLLLGFHTAEASPRNGWAPESACSDQSGSGIFNKIHPGK